MKRKNIVMALLAATFAICLMLAACSGFSFSVKFIVDGEEYAEIYTNGTDAIKMPDDPQKDCYAFDGWYWDEGVWEDPFTLNSLLNKPLGSNMNMRVYAKWNLDHKNLQEHAALAKSCTTDGNVRYWQCADCQSYLVEVDGVLIETTWDNVVLKAGHEFSNYVYFSETQHFEQCKVCGDMVLSDHQFSANGFCVLCGYGSYKGKGIADTVLTDAKFKAQPTGEGKYYLTSLGRADWVLAQTVINGAKYCNLGATESEGLVAADVEEGSVVFAVVGSSAKGLSGSGVTLASETQRATDFAKANADGKIKLIVIHLGGLPRRGENTDPLLEAACKNAFVTLIVDDYGANGAKGKNLTDGDGKISEWCGTTTPLYTYSKQTQLVESIQFIVAPVVVDVTISDASLKVDTTKPIYLTTVGQGSTFNTMKLMLDGLLTAEGYTADTLLKAEDVEAGATVFLVPHYSAKGMGGSSGIDAASELARAKAFAARKDITIVLIVNDRGTNSDKYLQELLPAANVVLFTSAQNADGKVAVWAGAGKTIYQFSRLSKMQDSVKFLLGK